MDIHEFIKQKQATCKKQPSKRKIKLEEFHDAFGSILSREGRSNNQRLDVENYSMERMQPPADLLDDYFKRVDKEFLKEFIEQKQDEKTE